MVRRTELTHDDRLHCRIPRDKGYTYLSITVPLGINFSERQARRACDTIRTTPQKKRKCGRRLTLTLERLDEVIF
jgi:hypothetical protein